MNRVTEKQERITEHRMLKE